MSSIIVFSDIDLGFGRNIYGDVSKKNNVNAIKQSVKNIVLAWKGSGKLFDPEFGTAISQLLFELVDDDFVSDMIIDDVKNELIAREPRIKNVNVLVDMVSSNNQISITINYSIRNLRLDDTVIVVVDRVR